MESMGRDGQEHDYEEIADLRTEPENSAGMEIDENNKHEDNKLRTRYINCSWITLGFLLTFVIVVAVTTPLVILSIRGTENRSNSRNASENRSNQLSTSENRYNQWNTSKKIFRPKAGNSSENISDSRLFFSLRESSMWDSWTSWGTCDRLCEQNRTRDCISKDNSSKDCQGSSRERKKCESYYLDCTEVYKDCKAAGVYKLQPDGSAGFDAYCDQGWTIIMKRYDGSQDFYLYWDDYKHGFGNKSGEHWLGNDNLHHLSNQGEYTLSIEIIYYMTNKSHYAEYSNFKVDNETNKYRLSVSGFRGDTKDSLRYHNKQAFSTRDRDNDKISFVHCAQDNKGGFWYTACRKTNPTGPYQSSGTCMKWADAVRNQCTSTFVIKMKTQ